MPALNQQTLFEESKCYTCLGVSAIDALKLAIRARISQSIQTDPYDGILVYIDSGGTHTVENPAGAYDFSFTDITQIHAHNCPNITSITLEVCPDLVVVDLENLSGLVDFYVINCDSLTELSIPNLADSMAGNLWVSECDNLLTVDLSGVQQVDRIIINVNNSLTSINVGSLVEATSQFRIDTCPSLVSVLVQSLELSSDLGVFTNAALPSISFTSLLSCDLFNASNNASIQSILLPVIQSVSVFIAVNACPNLLAFDISGIATYPPSFITADGSTLLGSFTTGGTIIPDGATASFLDCSLDEASVDEVLQSGVDGGMTSGTIELSGGANSPPSPSGVINANALILAGVSVTTN